MIDLLGLLIIQEIYVICMCVYRKTVKTAEEAAKMIRSIKKKLSHIDELESKRRLRLLYKCPL